MKKYSHIISLLLIAGMVYWSYYSLMPRNYSRNTPPDKFDTERALVHVKAMSQQPHYVGVPHHKEVREYVVGELSKMGLSVDIQEGYTFDRKILCSPKNIIARIKGTGNGNALLLMSHYDSSAHSALGASDAASGVAAIIEGIRAFKTSKLPPKNDIIILISDGEEVELSGAELFVKKHPWAKDVSVVLNFESRGSGGPSYMFIETNGGNIKMVKAFKEANVTYPTSNSLAYSIYKILPNDTDMTVFRKKADINGFNFAFIDDHYDYHTARDSYENLDKNSLEHQGSYLMPLLKHFAYSDISDLKSMKDDVYFSTPVGFYNYPFTWIFPMLIVAIVAFGFLLYLGFKTKRLSSKHVLLGFVHFIVALIVGTVFTHYGWILLLNIYPQYSEILHGFPYNGHWYIAAFIVFTLGICFLVYSQFKTREMVVNYTIAPLFLWLIVNVFVALYLKGAAFFIVPVFCCILMLYLVIIYEKPNTMVLAITAFPVVVILTPLLEALPVGLGLGLLAICTLLTVLIFGLMLPVFGFYRFKKPMAVLFFLLFVSFMVKAHFSSDFNVDRQKPNSLIYVLDTDENTAHWVTYDKILDKWTEKKMGKAPQNASDINTKILMGKQDKYLSYVEEAPVKNIPFSKIEFTLDTIIGNERHIKFCITPQRRINRMDIFTDDPSAVTLLSVNGEKVDQSEVADPWKSSEMLLRYYTGNDDQYLQLHAVIPQNKIVNLEISEISFDLLDNKVFSVPARSKNMIPKPFVLNDAVMLKKTIKL